MNSFRRYIIRLGLTVSGFSLGLTIGGIPIQIERVNLECSKELESMSRFCIDSFYSDECGKEKSFLARKMLNAGLHALRKAQLMEISLNYDCFRRIYVAKTKTNERIIGCCEVVEDEIDLSPLTDATINRRGMGNRSTRPRLIIENLCVVKEFRRAGLGSYLLRECERASLNWPLGNGEVYAQVDDDNPNAYSLFTSQGYQFLFESKCKRTTFSGGTLLMRQESVTKKTLRKSISSTRDILL